MHKNFLAILALTLLSIPSAHSAESSEAYAEAVTKIETLELARSAFNNSPYFDNDWQAQQSKQHFMEKAVEALSAVRSVKSKRLSSQLFDRYNLLIIDSYFVRNSTKATWTRDGYWVYLLSGDELATLIDTSKLEDSAQAKEKILAAAYSTINFWFTPTGYNGALGGYHEGTVFENGIATLSMRSQRSSNAIGEIKKWAPYYEKLKAYHNREANYIVSKVQVVSGKEFTIPNIYLAP